MRIFSKMQKPRQSSELDDFLDCLSWYGQAFGIFNSLEADKFDAANLQGQRQAASSH